MVKCEECGGTRIKVDAEQDIIFCKDCGDNNGVDFEENKITKPELKELDSKTDLMLLMDFRQQYYIKWVDFCRSYGYKAEIEE